MARLGNRLAGRDEGGSRLRFGEEPFDVGELVERFPTLIAETPAGFGRAETDGEGLSEIFVRVRLRIPIAEMLHVTFRIRTGPITFGRRFGIGFTEQLPPFSP